ncbi:MAG: iron-sulfur cluster assembly accessory protein [Hyphomicrobiales bacterium]|nr:iron-sulfur cluster assembly accessory protein [Hyphomicrobiales bacterium]
MALPPPINITEAAIARVKALLAQRGKPSVGIRVGVKKGGCSGLAYDIQYADTIGKFDEVVDVEGVKVIIDPKASIYLIGTTMDFVEEKMKSGFVFVNPNEKGRCGCGESFHV